MEQLKAAGGKAPSMNLVEASSGGKLLELGRSMVMSRSLGAGFSKLSFSANNIFGHPNVRVEVQYV